MRGPVPREPIEQRLAPLLATQHGVFSRDQARAAGATDRVIERRLAAGRWERLYPKVFRVAGGVSTPSQALLAAVLAWGDGTLASHRAAGHLWALPGMDAPMLEVTVPRGRRRSGTPGIRVHRASLMPRADRSCVDGIPVTAPARTLVDLAGVLDRDALEEVLDDALRRRLTTVLRVRRRLEQLGPRPGAAAIRALLAARDGSQRARESVFETRLFRVLRIAGASEPVPQFVVRHGGRRYRLDFAYPLERVAIEAESYRWHSGRASWERDLARRNALTTMGWRVVHVTWQDLSDGREQLVARVRALLAPRAPAPPRAPRR